MPIAEIEHWMKGERNYALGVKLFVHFGGTGFMQRMLERGETEFNRDKLAELLAAQSAAATEPTEPIVFKITGRAEYDALPEIIKKLEREKSENAGKMRHLHGQLLHQRSDKARLKMALAILRLEKEVQEAWDKLDYYAEHKTLPPEPVVTVKAKDDSPVALMKRRNNLRTYISKFENDADKRDKMKLWKKELAMIEEKLAA